MKVLLIFSVLHFGAVLALAQAENTASIMEQARKDGETLTLPVNKHNDAGLKAAQETSDHFHSPEFQEKIQGEQQRLEKEIFADHIAPWKKKQQTAGEQTEQAGNLTSKEKVYLFFSSSVPDETMQTYIATIAKAGDPNVIPVMRGWIKSISDTKADVAYFSRILKKDPSCRDTNKPCDYFQVGINLMPALFTKYNISQVPAIVYQNENDAYSIQGDAGLDYLLERINREAKSTTLASLIKKTRK